MQYSKIAVSIAFVTASFLLGYGQQLGYFLTDHFPLFPLTFYTVVRIMLISILFGFALVAGNRIIRRRDVISGNTSFCFMISAIWAIAGSTLQIGAYLLMMWMQIEG
ncbi:hypothetical protein NCCP2716_17450 [Sporosarcina sp. NCCP-2716]|nr:hypothetical protein NCCP2716_17450 [Sporosarcina sp. NCCP-2716]